MLEEHDGAFGPTSEEVLQISMLPFASCGTKVRDPYTLVLNSPWANGPPVVHGCRRGMVHALKVPFPSFATYAMSESIEIENGFENTGPVATHPVKFAGFEHMLTVSLS